MNVISIKVIGAVCAVSLAGLGHTLNAQLLQDSFSDGNFTSSPTWTVSTGTWSVSGGAVTDAGTTVANDYLTTKDFTAITNGVFSLSVDIKFDSSDVTGNNRFYLRMRDSTAGSAGYEVAIAQGTFNNSTFNLLGGATVGTLTKASTAHTFSTSSFVNVTWTRDSSGKMTVFVDGSEYMSVSSSSVSSFDTLQIGGRGVVASPAATYTFSFDNIQLSSIPEPRSAAMWFGGLSVFAATMYRRR